MRVPRFKLTIEYAGTRYSGWQKQKNARTVQGEIERAVAEVTGERTFECQGSGRTDAGVHALAQVAHLDVRTRLQPEILRRRLNEALPADVNVIALTPAPHRFHARHAARSRWYVYQIAQRRTAFAKPYVWWVKDPLDLETMTIAAQQFVGLHDFRSFTDDDPEEKSTEVLIDEVRIEPHGALVLVRIVGSHFLWKMVRRMIGVLVEVGRGELRPADVARFLREPSDVPARLTAPASGLFLERVLYSTEAHDRTLTPPVPVR